MKEVSPNQSSDQGSISNEGIEEVARVKRGFNAIAELISGLGITTIGLMVPESIRDEVLGIISTPFRYVQAAFQNRALEEIMNDVKHLQKIGRLTSRASSISLDSVTEMLEFIDSMKVSDTERFKAIKDLFLYGLLDSTQEQERFLSLEYMKITKDLQGADILILKACYELYKKYQTEKFSFPMDLESWSRTVARQLGNEYSHFILSREPQLLKHGLIGRRTAHDNSGISYGNQGRLSDWGIGYCEFLAKANDAVTGNCV